MQHLAIIILLICTMLPFPVAGLAQESGQAQRPADKQEQKHGERKRKERDDAQAQQQQAAVRCTRIKRKQ